MKKVILSSLTVIVAMQAMNITTHDSVSAQGQVSRIKQALRSQDTQALELLAHSSSEITLASLNQTDLGSLQGAIGSDINILTHKAYRWQPFSLALGLSIVIYCGTYEYIKQSYHYDRFLTPTQPLFQTLLLAGTSAHGIKCYWHYQNMRLKRALNDFKEMIDNRLAKKNA